MHICHLFHSHPHKISRLFLALFHSKNRVNSKYATNKKSQSNGMQYTMPSEQTCEKKKTKKALIWTTENEDRGKRWKKKITQTNYFTRLFSVGFAWFTLIVTTLYWIQFSILFVLAFARFFFCLLLICFFFWLQKFRLWDSLACSVKPTQMERKQHSLLNMPSFDLLPFSWGTHIDLRGRGSQTPFKPK